MAQFQVDYIKEGVTNLRARGVAGSSLSKRRCVVASNKYLINCLALVQPDFEINEALNSIIIERVRGVGLGEGFAIVWGCYVILGSR